MEVEQKQKLRTRALFMASHLDGNKTKDQGGRTLQHFPPIVASGQNTHQWDVISGSHGSNWGTHTS